MDSAANGPAAADVGGTRGGFPPADSPTDPGGGGRHAGTSKAPDPWGVASYTVPVSAAKADECVVVSHAPRRGLSGGVVPAILTAVVMVGYGLSFFVNSILGRFLHEPHWSTSLLLNCAGRAITLAVALPFLHYWDGRPPLTSITLSKEIFLPVCIAFVGTTGFVAYFEFVKGGDVSVITPMVGLYTVIPVTVALVWRGEERTRKKFIGIALSCAAVVLLGMSGNSFTSTEDTGSTDSNETLYKACMFLIAFALWGLNDVMSSRVTLDHLRVAGASMVGYMACAVFMGIISFAVSSQEAYDTAQTFRTQLQAGGNATIAVEDPVVFGWPHIAVMFANSLAIIGWLAFVRLGQIGEASVFIPIISLYTLIPVGLSVVVLGESINLLKGVGIFVAAAAVLLMSRSWKTKQMTDPQHT